jgi:hypothetical protein
MVDDGSDKPFHVSAADGTTWWYNADALELVEGPASVAAAVVSFHIPPLVIVVFVLLLTLAVDPPHCGQQGEALSSLRVLDRLICRLN